MHLTSHDLFVVLQYDKRCKKKPFHYYQDGKGGDPILQFNPTTTLCLSQGRTWISLVMVLF